MDSLSHIYFAYKLLTVVHGDVSTAVCSLFPQIDREPAYLHRMYAHPFFMAGRLSGPGAHVYRSGEIMRGCEGEYAWIRFHQDRARMVSFSKQFEEETQLSLGTLSDDLPSITLSYVSHTYVDVFNNPMQAFLPQFPYPCGKWELWTELGAISFRTALYASERISSFREEFFEHPIWNITLDLYALITAMVVRTAEASALPVPDDVVESAVISLGSESMADPSEIETAVEFLVELEGLLVDMMRKHSSELPARPRGLEPIVT